MRRSAAGFTLTELTLVMAVLATLAGMAMASLGWVASAAESVALARIRSALVFAQEWAQGTSHSTWVAFDVAADTVSVYVEDPANPGKANRLSMMDPLTRSPMELTLGAYGVGIDSALLGAGAEVEFDGEGAPRDAAGAPWGADGTVVVTGGGTVRVTRGTGLVTID